MARNEGSGGSADAQTADGAESSGAADGAAAPEQPSPAQTGANGAIATGDGATPQPATADTAQAAIERQRAQLQAEREELDRLRQAVVQAHAALASRPASADPGRDAAAGPTPQRNAPAFSSDDYDAAARHFGESGDHALARLAQQQALAQRQVEGHAQQHAFSRQWWDHVHQAIQAEPELKDQSSDLGRAVQGLLKEHPLFSAQPDGFRHAVALAKAQRDAASAGGLRTQLEAMKRENERLSKLTAITGTPPARPAAEKANAMNERDLRRLAAEHDNQ
jgi:hypothetical protein